MNKQRWSSAWLIGAGVLLLLASCWAWHTNGLFHPLLRNGRQTARKQLQHDPAAAAPSDLCHDR